jgi:hypothetical protein
MKNFESYFIKQEEEVSNTYMDASGPNEPQNDRRQTNIDYIKEHSSIIIFSVVVVASLIYAFKYIGIKPQI